MREKVLFKDHINPKLVQKTASSLKNVWPAFDEKGFNAAVIPELPSLELKDRVLLITHKFREFLPSDYPEALRVLMKVIGDTGEIQFGDVEAGFNIWPFASFVEVYGLDHFEESMQAIYEITQCFTGEFAIRPYLLQDQEKTIALLRKWLTDSNHHVRRLISEGTRPYLPWGSNLPAIIKDPSPVLELLEALKDDPSEYVRRSVANNLNGISKDHPDTVLDILERWQKSASKGTTWIIRHALRTLLKEGHPRALALLGYHPPQLQLHSLELSTPQLKMGETLGIQAKILSSASSPQQLMVDYLIHFVKANGKQKPKVFKWKTAKLPPGENISLEKRHTIKPITTRKYYSGTHRVEIQVNGVILGGVDFDLVV